MNLEDLKRLEQVATPPPWCVAPGSFNTLVLSPGKVTIASLGWNTRQVDRMHAAYIAAARNALPTLLRVAEAAREWERVTTEHVNGTADEVIAARRAARAELRAALAALEGNDHG